MYDFATDAADQIARNVDGLVKSVHGSQALFHRCRNAAGQLAGTVYAFVEDPESVGTDALRAAWQTYMQLDSGNFGYDPEPVSHAAS